MRADTDVNAKPRGPPAPGRVICPFRPAAFRRAGCIRDPAGADPQPETVRLRRGPRCDGLTRENSRAGPFHICGNGTISTPKSQ